jgi:hypothetical protein
MPLIVIWAEVEEEDKNYVFSGVMKSKEESSLLPGLMKMEDEEEEKETSIFSGVMEMKQGR